MDHGEPRRVWLITGATSGFGRALAEAALAVGDTVVGASRNPQRLNDLVTAHPIARRRCNST